MAIKINGTTVIDNSRNLTSIEAATFTGTGYVKVPSGTDAQRPVSPSNGMFRYNTTSNTFEGYVSGAWVENLHTGNIAPTHIPEDITHRWTTDAEKTNWNAAYTHSQAAHAPSTAQKNSDITKAEIEAKLTGTISTHIHTDGNADTVDGYHAQKTAAADKIPVAGADGKLDMGWLPSALQGGAGFADYTTPGSYNFTVPEGVTKIYTEVQGAGGGGCVYNSSRSAGSAGGSSSVGALLSAGGGGGGASKNVAPNPGSVSGANLNKPISFVSEAGRLNAVAGSGGNSPYGTGGGGYSNTSVAGSGGTGVGNGAGGGGANKNGNEVCDAPGGAAGGFGCGVYGVTPGSTITITVGSGGAGGNINSWRGGTGGNGFVKLWWW